MLGRPCPECRFDSRAVVREAIGDVLAANVAQWPAVLRRADVVTRPSPGKWSPLEYACHVRDVFRIYDERLKLMLTESDPLYANWDQDATAVRDRYGEQDPDAVGVELTSAGEDLASHFATVAGEQWDRPGRRSDGARFTVDTFSRYFLHDPVHHLHDVSY